MISGIPSTSFWLLMLCAFCAGALGAAALMAVLSLVKRKKNKVQAHSAVKRISRDQAAPGWQRMAQDEQLYNGR